MQSALLEAMEEKQVTVGHKSYPLPELYMVIATQNPIEQEEHTTFPEAQLDRFMMHLEVDYPNPQEELLIVELDEKDRMARLPRSCCHDKRRSAAGTKSCVEVFISESLKKYVVSLITATRTPEKYDQLLAQWIDRGASPRATIAMIRCAKALAWLRAMSMSHRGISIASLLHFEASDCAIF